MDRRHLRLATGEDEEGLELSEEELEALWKSEPDLNSELGSEARIYTNPSGPGDKLPPTGAMVVGSNDGARVIKTNFTLSANLGRFRSE